MGYNWGHIYLIGNLMPLTAQLVKNAKPKAKRYKLYDSKGLYLSVEASGSKYWRMKYRFGGKENTSSFGTYPEITLKNARNQAQEARSLLNQDIDPNQQRQNARDKAKIEKESVFKLVAYEWLNNQKDRYKPATMKKKRWFIEKILIPKIGTRPINDISPQQVLKLLKALDKKGTLENTKRAKIIISQIFRFAVASGLCQLDPTRDIADALKPKKTKHRAALIKPEDVARLISAIESYQGTQTVKQLMKMSYLTIQRPGEVRQMLWSEVDMCKEQWELCESQKMDIPQIIPLSKQAMGVLQLQKPLTGHSNFVFLSDRNPNKPISDATVTKALRVMGFAKEEMTAYGFRAMGRTILDEVLEFEPHLIEQQISHTVRDPLGRAYNRTQHLKQRRQMLQVWADYLNGLVNGEKDG